MSTQHSVTLAFACNGLKDVPVNLVSRTSFCRQPFIQEEHLHLPKQQRAHSSKGEHSSAFEGFYMSCGSNASHQRHLSKQREKPITVA